MPAGRTTVLAAVTVLLLLALAGAGWWRGGVQGPVRRLLPLGLAGLVLAARSTRASISSAIPPTAATTSGRSSGRPPPG